MERYQRRELKLNSKRRKMKVSGRMLGSIYANSITKRDRRENWKLEIEQES